MYYEQILSNMLNKLPDNYDKRQGSILYDILANFRSIFRFKFC